MSVSFGGVGEVVATFKTEGEVKAGWPVKMAADGTVSECAADERFCGIALCCEGGFASVQLKGYAAANCADSMTAGYAKIVADGNGGVKTGTAGGECLVIGADAKGNIGFIM